MERRRVDRNAKKRISTSLIGHRVWAPTSFIRSIIPDFRSAVFEQERPENWPPCENVLIVGIAPILMVQFNIRPGELR